MKPKTSDARRRSAGLPILAALSPCVLLLLASCGQEGTDEIAPALGSASQSEGAPPSAPTGSDARAAAEGAGPALQNANEEQTEARTFDLDRVQDPRTADLTGISKEIEAKIIEAREALDADPENPELWRNLAFVYHANILPTLAAATYEELLKLAPERAETWYQLALARMQKGDPEGALTCVNEAIARDETKATYFWRRGNWLFDRGDYDLASASYERALALDPSDPAAMTGLARIALEEDRNENAVALLSDVVQGNEEMPFAPYARRLLATAYRRLGEEDRAGALEAVGIEGPPAWYDPINIAIASYGVETLFHRAARATGLANQGRFAEAAEEMRAVVEATPDEAARRNQYARFLALSNQPQKAIEQYRETLARTPDDREALVAVGRYLGQTGNTKEGLQFLDRAVELEPLFAAAHFFRGSLLRREGRIEEAVAAYRRSVELDETQKTPWIAVGLLELELKHYEEALQAFSRGEELGLDRPDLWLGKSEALLQLRRFQESMDCLEKCDRSYKAEKFMGLYLAAQKALKEEPKADDGAGEEGTEEDGG